MNKRRSLPKMKSAELRNCLEVQINGNTDCRLNRQVLDVTNWLMEMDSDLDSVGTPACETSTLHSQRERLKEICLKLERRHDQVEQLLKCGESETLNTDLANGRTLNGNGDCSETEKTSNDPVVLLQKKWSEVNRKSIEYERKVCRAIESFQTDLICNQGKVEMCMQSANDLQRADDCTLSSTNRSCLNNQQENWSRLDSILEERLQQVTSAMKNYSGMQYHLSMAVYPPWERSLAEADVPFYINHSTETTQWDHPEMTKILSSLADLNNVKFSAYRTSMKLRRLQKRFSLDRVGLNEVLEAFDCQGLREFSLRTLTVAEVVQCLTAIYNSIAAQRPGMDINASLCIDLVLNWLLNMYDSFRTGQIPSVSFRVAILVMCSALVERKHKALFNSVANGDGLVSQQQLGLLLQACIQIPKQLGEIAAFGGSNVDPSIRSCFEKAGNPSEIKVSHFLDWVKLEPQSLVWLPVLHRLATAESAKHQAQCNVCRDCPIIGFRYRCLKCFSFDMCQNCFFAGRKVKSHKLTHPMQEYCMTTTSSEDMRDFTKMFRNKFRSKQYFKKHPRLGYLPVQSFEEEDPMERSIETTISDTFVDSNSPLNVVVSNSSHWSPSTCALNSQDHDHCSFFLASQTAHNTRPVQSCSLNSSISNLELHSRLELFAHRLATVEQRRRETTPDWDDEHSLILQYCKSLHRNSRTRTLQSPMQIMMTMDAELKTELETMVRDLEDENKLLQAEYDQLKEVQREELNELNAVDRRVPNRTDSQDAEMIVEAELLRQHKGRLEMRMQLLEEHNHQLDSQLKRLRLLLAEQGRAT